MRMKLTIPLPPLDPMAAYDRPHQPEVTFDKLHLYQPSQLSATRRMYNQQYCLPIALLCMSMGVPSCIPPPMKWRRMIATREHLHVGRGVCIQRRSLFQQTRHRGRSIFRRN